MTPETHSQHSHPGALHRVLSSAYGLLQTRIELLGIEFAEERSRLLTTLLLGLATIMLGMTALICLTALVVIAYWDTCRWAMLIGVTIFYALAALVCAFYAYSKLHNAPPLFSSLLDEFAKDRDALRKP